MRVILKDEYIFTIWFCGECKLTCEVPITFFQDNGTPVCINCDKDMLYKSTELEIPGVFSMYKCTCKKCSNSWESREKDQKCPACGAEGSAVIGFSYIEPGPKPGPEPEPKPETDTEPEKD